MRTTLDIDPDVLEAAKEISARSKRTAGQVISDLARRALSSPSPPGKHAKIFNGFEILPVGDRIVTAESIRKLIEDSE